MRAYFKYEKCNAKANCKKFKSLSTMLKDFFVYIFLCTTSPSPRLVFADFWSLKVIRTERAGCRSTLGHKFLNEAVAQA